MEVENSSQFRTPASRRSPVQLGRNKQEAKDQGIVTQTFEAMKMYSRNGLSNNGAWLTDRVCEDAVENLGIIMPPIGYECELRTFRDAKDVDRDPEFDNGYKYDIYEDATTHDCNDNIIDQGTISHITDNETKHIGNLNEFGFGYRNGYAFNRENEKAKNNSALYLINKHKSSKDIINLEQHKMTPLSGGRDGKPRKIKSKNFNYHNNRGNTYSSRGSNYSNSKPNSPRFHDKNVFSSNHYDKIEDVTARSTAGGSERGISGRRLGGRSRAGSHASQFHSSKSFTVENDRNDDVDNMLSYESTKTDQRNGFGFGYSSSKFNDATGEEETKEEQNGNANPMAWTSKFDFFSSKPTSEERRRESFVSEYSNYTPDGQSRQRRLFST